MGVRELSEKGLTAANPQSVEELASLVGAAAAIVTTDRVSHRFALPFDGGRGREDAVEVSSACLPVEIIAMPDDQVVIVRGPASWEALKGRLEPFGQCLPHGALCPELFDGDLTPVGGAHLPGAMDVNLPHVLEAQCGSWRDWVLGMTVVLADGTIAKSGSQAVKNVAGYDLHKFFVGARGTLGIIVEVILRTYPIKALSKPEVEFNPGAGHSGTSYWIQRTLATDFPAAVRAAGPRLIVADHASSTLWASVPPDDELDRFAGDWVLRSGCGRANLRFDDPAQVKLMKRTKELFDPTRKLNPGAMGIF